MERIGENTADEEKERRKEERRRGREKESREAPAAGLVLIQHFNKSMPLEENNLHPELS